ncbi:hypothetical protein NUW54_g1453 [Trametes sanguinea]|uniref:Uncharacterized protein n=1 Tax=Trametes sanguinea TaxID=158606 RepID=A0ACC1Q9H3_9APHY|nr:hypothetical protein NUW54_g1453 [Trametes sanguinea]
MTANDHGPPWFAFNPDGSVHLGGVPEQILRHPGLQKRGITLVDAVKPVRQVSPNVDSYDIHNDLDVHHQGVAFRSVEHRLIVKALNLNTEELQIYERLILYLAEPANHIVPCEIDRAGHPLLIMPILWDITSIIHRNHTPHSRVLRVFYELVEGVEYLHRHRIVHMDICFDNAMVALQQDIAVHPELVPSRVYLIDFDSARQFHLGPGVQPATDLPPTQADPPPGLTYFDSYSWDVYCLGRLFEFIADCWFKDQRKVPWITRWYMRWLIGNERGCRGVCHCRPTAKTARRILGAIRVIWPVLDIYYTISTKVSGVLSALRFSYCRPTARAARVVLAIIRLMGPLIDLYDKVSSKLSRGSTS